jgi:hypothetical protein
MQSGSFRSERRDPGHLRFAVLVVSAAQATVIIENPSVDHDTQHLFALGQDWAKAMGFTMGATSFHPDSVSLRLCFEEEGANHCEGAFGVTDDDIPPCACLAMSQAPRARSCSRSTTALRCRRRQLHVPEPTIPPHAHRSTRHTR